MPPAVSGNSHIIAGVRMIVKYYFERSCIIFLRFVVELSAIFPQRAAKTARNAPGGFDTFD